MSKHQFINAIKLYVVLLILYCLGVWAWGHWLYPEQPFLKHASTIGAVLTGLYVPWVLVLSMSKPK